MLSSILLMLASSVQNVKAYLRRGTAREMVGYYKDAIDGESVHYSLMKMWVVVLTFVFPWFFGHKQLWKKTCYQIRKC